MLLYFKGEREGEREVQVLLYFKGELEGNGKSRCSFILKGEREVEVLLYFKGKREVQVPLF